MLRSKLSHILPPSSPLSSFKSRTFFFLSFSHPHFTLSSSHSLPMPRNQRSGVQQRWVGKPKTEAIGNVETVADKLSGIHIAESYGTVSGGATVTEVESTPVGSGSLSNISRANMLEKFTVDNSTYAHARIRASFYPKFENEKSDQETRSRMIELVSKGLATLEVSLKHSGSLFMYAGHEGGAYAKNSFGNIYTAVGVFVLGRMFCEAWGTEALKKQAEFNNFLEKNHMCISMELVTAVLGDHGQRPHEDYVVVTAVTELGNGKPKFYSTPEIIAFCRKWRLPTNHVWLFSTRKSASSFFAAYDALYEEGTATSVCMALDEIADVSVPASKDHVKGQGEILEGLVARLVSHESSNHIEKILKEFPPPPADGAALDFGPSLREICAANRSDEKQQVKALLESVGSSFCPDYSDWSGTDAADVHSRNADKSVLPKFLQAHPADYSTKKLQEIIRLMREKRLPAAFKCYHNFHKVDATSNNNLFYKMVIHVHSDSAFRRYQNEMRKQPGLWPLYRGFFVDINLFKADKEKVTEISKDNSINESGSSSTEKDDFADEDANLMVKLKFLTYKLRTFLIRNGLSILFKEGTGAYKAYYLRQMKKWGISPGKQRELSKMLDEWALYITRKCGKRQLSSSIYLSEAEPFLEQFAKRCPQNQALIGSAGNLVRTEDFLAIVEGGQDEEGDLVSERDITPSGPNISVRDTVPKDEGMIVFFPALYVNFEHDPSAPLVKQVFLHPASATRIVLPDGRYMAYKEQGVSADRARFSIIAPHTFLSSRLAGIPGVKDSLLEEFGIRLLTYDLPGFGESDPHPKRSLESSAIDMSFLADALGVDKFWVIGYSSGSKHAWAALRYIPDRLAGAAMFAPMVNPYDLLMTNEERRRTWNKWTRKRKLMYFLARRFPRLLSFFYQRSFLSGKHGQIDRWLSLSLGSRDKALMEDPIYEEFWQRDVEESIRQGNAKPFVEEAALQVSNWGFSLLDLRLQKRKLNRNVLNWLKAMFTETQEYTGFLGPIHIWHGMDDKVVPPSMTDFVHRVLPGAAVHKLPYEGHFTYIYFCHECHRQIFTTLFGTPQGPLILNHSLEVDPNTLEANVEQQEVVASSGDSAAN